MQVLIVSELDEDTDFGRRLAGLLKTKATALHGIADLRESLREDPESFVIWGIDQPSSSKFMRSTSAGNIARAVAGHDPSRVLAVSSTAIGESINPLGSFAFNHHAMRRYSPAFEALIAKVLKGSTSRDPFGIANYLPYTSKFETVELSRASHRSAANEAILNTLKARGMPPRLCAKIAEATDELIMNAIYDAPVDKEGTRYRAETSRRDDFALSGREAVTVRVGTSTDYLAISVTDQFGSLKTDAITNTRRRSYVNRKYLPRIGTGAGLGLYQLRRSGLSLLMICHEGVACEAILFVPRVKLYSQFARAFQFQSFVVIESQVRRTVRSRWRL